MTQFVKENFIKSGDYLMYAGPFEGQKTYREALGPDREIHPTRENMPMEAFIARFKYQRGGMASFQNFLIKNFTVEEYISRQEAGEAPMQIAESKGYLLPHIKKMLKRRGYEVTPQGFAQMISDQIFNKMEEA